MPARTTTLQTDFLVQMAACVSIAGNAATAAGGVLQAETGHSCLQKAGQRHCTIQSLGHRQINAALRLQGLKQAQQLFCAAAVL